MFFTKDGIFNTIQPMIKFYTDVPIQYSSWIQTGLGLDSLDCVELIMQIEDEFQIELEDDVVIHWRLVQHIVDGIYEILSKKYG